VSPSELRACSPHAPAAAAPPGAAETAEAAGPGAPPRRAWRHLRIPALGVLLALTSLTACVTLRPFAEVRREQPAGRYVEVDGHQIYVEQQGRGEAVVLLHGFGASSYSWRHLVPELAKSYHVVAPDLFGFGWTERPRDAASYTREGQVRMVLGLLQVLGIRKAQFVGHSYGGALTLYLASRHPEIATAIVLVDSAAPTYPEDRRTRLANLLLVDRLALQLALRPFRVRRSLLGSVHDPSVVTPELVRSYIDRLRVEGEVEAYYGLTARLSPASRADGADPAAPPGQIRHADHAKHGGDSGTGPPAGDVDLRQISMPALVVWGSDDRVIPVADGSQAAKRLPRGEFAAISKAGHMPMEDRPEEVLRLLLPFLAAHRGG
jgi:pimeloyl-ACP methyl ester carboxylesterase